MKIVITSDDLPGRHHCQPDGTTLTNVHVGIQIGNQPHDLIRADANSAHWHLEIRTVDLPDGDLDFRGPAVHGTRGERFLYLTWVNLEPDHSFTMFRRAKLMLNRINPELVRQAALGSAALAASVHLTDPHGHPRCARVDPPAITWTLTPT